MADRIEEVLVHLEYLRKGQDETNAHLKTLNGRVGKHDTAIVELRNVAGDAQKLAGAAVTKRDFYIGLTVLVLAGGLVTWLFQLVPYIRLAEQAK